MSNKYTIQNCPCNVTTEDICDWENTNKTYCQDCTDCILKQIVQVCNEYSDKWEDCDFSNGLADEILKLLGIQECE